MFKDGKKAPVKALYTRAPFVQHSSLPQSLGYELTTEGYIKVDAAHKTAVPGLYACGDTTTRLRTVANAVFMATTTGLMANGEPIGEEI